MVPKDKDARGVLKFVTGLAVVSKIGTENSNAISSKLGNPHLFMSLQLNPMPSFLG